MRTLYRGGTVYSDADPFATALLTESGTVAWLGAESGADVQERTADAVVDLAGRLLTPGFVDAGFPSETDPDDLAALGVVAAPGLSGQATWAGEVGVLQALPLGVVAALDPRALPVAADLAEVAAAGVPLALGTAPGAITAPWELVRHALARGLSARAAFAAHTRGAWRAAGAAGGSLRPGAAASLVVWEPCELVVQVADEHRSAWSSDERAGVPPLPLLGALADADWRPPGAWCTVVDGVVTHLAPSAAT